MLKLNLLSVGKTKEKWLEEAIAEYTKRLQSTLLIKYTWVKNDEQLLKLTEQESALICLDPKGDMFTSKDFSKFIMKEFETQRSKLTFVIGGAKGLPRELKQKGKLISLSKMTFTHQCTRLILMEQVYRALEIAKGSQYHK